MIEINGAEMMMKEKEIEASLRWRFLKFYLDDYVSRFGWMVDMIKFFELIGEPVEDEVNKILDGLSNGVNVK